jgi:hypothetical protein
VRRLPPDLSLAPGLGDVQDRCPADDGGHCSVADWPDSLTWLVMGTVAT